MFADDPVTQISTQGFYQMELNQRFASDWQVLHPHHGALGIELHQSTAGKWTAHLDPVLLNHAIAVVIRAVSALCFSMLNVSALPCDGSNDKM